MVKAHLSGRRSAACLFILAAGLVIVGCSGDSSDSKPLPEQIDSKTASPTPREGKHAEALAAYRAMWRDLTEAAKTSDASSPQLDDHASGAALDMLKQGLQSAKAAKIVSKGTPRLHPVVTAESERTVRLRDCVDSTDWLQYKLNGELKNDVPGGHAKAEAAVERTGEDWKITELAIHQSGTC